jgi:predicted O-linked N-acetylglucosamine transferase (SPINDLY family)
VLKNTIQPHANDRAPERRLRIGYVCPYFCMLPEGRFLLPLLRARDRSCLEVICYSDCRRPDAFTEQFRQTADGWHDIVGWSDLQVAERMRQDRIDIAVDLTLHGLNNRLLALARKPAPVQVTYLAYCSSTGLEAIDYRLSDPYLDPPGMDESVYSEKTMRLPETYWCYQPTSAPPETSPLPALAQGHITFGSLNNFCKVSAPTLAAWGKLLRSVPNAQLLLHTREGSHRQRVLERLGGEGIEPQRVRFAGYLPMEQYFELYQRIDIALDSFPCGGGTTTCDALWMGVPVVSLVGRTAVGRGGLSILSNVGMPELAARSEEEYVRIARELANDIPRLTNLRATLRQRMEQSPLMDTPRFARNIEAAYRQMWRQWCAAV